MGISKGEKFAKQDVYVDYAFEDVMFRWDHKRSKIFVKFYGELENKELVPHDNRLFNDALLYGEEITREQYLKGK
ncbi:MAG: hypothetical protein OQK95_12540 [Gammaproteobacteria bacterium]|nr:hypothetical protein [Gammaproteobacteria bacterium]